MAKEETKKRIDKLKNEINHHRFLYHVEDKPSISDAALDSLKNELFKLEMQYPELITADSPTQRVGGQALDKFEKVGHSVPMLSLFDAFSREDMTDWEKRFKKLILGKEKDINYYTELKLDGLAIALRYEAGILTLGATRGDGKVGENVTHNLKTFESVPLSLRLPSEKELGDMDFSKEQIDLIVDSIKNGIIEIRGEAVMSKKVFKQINKEYEKAGKAPFANPRNGAAGSIRQLDPKLAAERKLDFYAYSIVTDLDLTTHEQEHQLAKLLGFKVIEYNKYCLSLSDVFDIHAYWDKHRSSLPYECDGLVVKINNLSLWSLLGVVGKAPRYMMAYKFAAEQVTTVLKNVVWQVGRTGILTPTAVLEPVQVGGVVVGHATLHNMDEIERLGIKIGDTVIIERAGDVIPKIVQALPNLRTGQEKNISLPEHCPQCGSEAKKIAGEVAYRCTNENCYAVQLRRLIHWASKGALDIEGLGPKIIEQLVREGLVGDIADFYSLSIGDLKPLERFADKSAENLIKSISEKKRISLARFLFGLGIRHVGEESAIVLAEKFRSLGALKKASLVELENIYDFGGVMANSVFGWFNDKINLKLLEKLESLGVEPISPEIIQKNSEFKGKSFVVTGTLDSLTRDEAKAKIRELGGSISASVSAKTDFVVVGENPGSKYEKAIELGIKILSEEEFVKLIAFRL